MSKPKRKPARKPSKKIYKDKTLQSLRSSVHWKILNSKSLAAGNWEYAYFIKTELEKQWREGTRKDIVIGDKVIKFRSLEKSIANKFASTPIAGKGNLKGAWEAIRAYRQAVGAPDPKQNKSVKKSTTEVVYGFTHKDLFGYDQRLNELIHLIKATKLSQKEKDLLITKVKHLCFGRDTVVIRSIRNYLSSFGRKKHKKDRESREFWARVRRGEFDETNKAERDRFREELNKLDEQDEDMDWEEEYQELAEKLRTASGEEKKRLIDEIGKLKDKNRTSKLSKELREKIKARDRARQTLHGREKDSKKRDKNKDIKAFKALPKKVQEEHLKMDDKEFEMIFGFKKKDLKS